MKVYCKDCYWFIREEEGCGNTIIFGKEFYEKNPKKYIMKKCRNINEEGECSFYKESKIKYEIKINEVYCDDCKRTQHLESVYYRECCIEHEDYVKGGVKLYTKRCNYLNEKGNCKYYIDEETKKNTDGSLSLTEESGNLSLTEDSGKLSIFEKIFKYTG
jgi:hypothetical protein